MSKSQIKVVEKPENKMFNKFYELLKRTGKLDGYKMNAELWEHFEQKQQKRRRKPNQRHDSVDKELDRLIKSGHFEKAGEKNEVVIQRTMITVKHDRIIKIALDVRAMNTQKES